MREQNPPPFEVPAQFAGTRIDKALAALLPEHSRAEMQQWLKRGLVLVDGEHAKQSYQLRGGENLEVFPPSPQPSDSPAQQVDFEIVAHDEDLLIINKPAGLVVHPGAGQPDRTLLNGLLHADDELRTLPRAGIVHRLDKGTSGLLAVARNENARRDLIAQLQAHDMTRRYSAVVSGVPVAGECIDQPVGRHRRERLRMCVTPRGKPAVTHVRVERKYRNHCLIRAELETGRTHQIRVHLSWRGFPLVGDPLYAGRARVPAGASEKLRAALAQFKRQALHAAHLSLRHPRSGEVMRWERPPPEDFRKLVDALEEDSRPKK
ncbi:MAG: RluA family pseudouridine synthase [Gammaproteobacteria bacterium]|nr:RluA family pseudouridine synthase [Gammaproteobacteria bacterium]